MPYIRSLIVFLINFCFIMQVLAVDVPASPNVEDTPISSSLGIPNVRSVQNFSSFADIVEPLIPTVVNIYSVQYNKQRRAGSVNPFEGFPSDQFNNLFEQFSSNNFGSFEEMYSDPKATSLGSGFIIDPDGYIVTNYHVIRNADEVYVKLDDNSELPARLIGSDQKTDLALLKVELKKPLPFVKFGDTGKARVGDRVIAIGNPFGFGGTVTAGIISSKSRDINDEDGIVDDFIQTDAAINSGNSGGPLFNLAGEVIGVNTAIFSPSGTNVGIGFAIPSSTAEAIIEQIKKNGKVSRGKLDVKIQEVTPEIAEGLGLKDSTGVLIVEVFPDGAGSNAGLKPGDVIVEFAGQTVKNSRKLQVLVAEAPINKEVKITVISNGKKHELITKINEKESIKKQSTTIKDDGIVDKNSFAASGITFSDVNDNLRQKFNIQEKVNGVIVTSIPSAPKGYGLKVGDLIAAVNQQQVTTTNQVKNIYDEAKKLKKKNVVLLVKRHNINLFIALPIL